MGVRQLLRNRADDFDIDGLREARELLERVADIPGLAVLVDSDQERVLNGLMGFGKDAGNGRRPSHVPARDHVRRTTSNAI